MNNLYTKVVLRVPLLPLASATKEVDLNLPFFQEGLYIAAFDLWQELEKAEFNWANLNDKVKRSVSKYWIRSCTRCTPYGLFAGTFLTTPSATTRQIISRPDYNNLEVKLDMNFLNILIDEIASSPIMSQHLKYVNNNSLYLVSDSYRYAESINVSGYTTFELTKVAKTEYLAFVLSYLSDAEKTVNEISHAISEKFNASLQDSEGYVGQLIASNIIVNNLQAIYTGKNSLEQLTDKIESYGIKNNSILSKIKILGHTLDHPRQGVSYYKALNQQIGELLDGHIAKKNIFQVDMAVNCVDSEVDKSLIHRIVNQVQELKVFCKDHPHPDLAQFKELFRKRYEGREVPLTTALDTDQGIGYGFSTHQLSGSHDFTSGLFISGENERVETYSRVHELLIKKTIRLKELKQNILEITDEDMTMLNTVVTNKFENTDKFIMGSLMKKNGLLNKDSFQFELKSFGGTNAANLLGRFSSLSREFDDYVKEIIGHEESFSPDTIYAEVVHVPHPRLGNVISRTNFRKYEIPYISNSGIPKENQILISDLMVSIQDDEVVLRSFTHNKKVIPCLTTAHNFSQGNLPVYKFLCDLQLQKRSTYTWDWGPLNTLESLPRVVYKDIIVQLAKWNVIKSSFSSLPTNTDDFVSYFEGWRSSLSIPVMVTISDNDNELFIDFRKKELISIFLDLLNKKEQLTIKEFLATEENSIIRDTEDNGYNNEIIIPLKKQYENKNVLPTKLIPAHSARRVFEPGSEWLTVKIYGGNKNLDAILCSEIASFVKEYRGQLFSYFFFVRYFDTDNHIRIRFFSPEKPSALHLYDSLMKVLHPLIQNERLFKIQVDTYERELERYSEKLIFETEQLFDVDSATVLEFLELLEGNEEKYRWLFAMRSIDRFLDDFGLSDLDKTRVIDSMSLSFFREHGGQKYLRKQINSRFRQHQVFIFSHMDQSNDSSNDIEEIGDLLDNRSKRLVDIINSIKANLSPEELLQMIPNYIHMFMNRLFITQQRKCELVVYIFMERYYLSRKARNSSLKSLLMSKSDD